MTSEAYARARAACEAVKSRTDFRPRAALVLGSGLGAFADSLDVADAIPYSEIDGFPTSSVPGHAGRLVLGTLGGVPLAVLQGRVHVYEGYSPSEAVIPVRAAGLLGAETLILTNASGAINPDFAAGDLALIEDHILHNVASPLAGANDDGFGTRFPDMSETYSKKLRTLARAAAAKLGLRLPGGVYIQTAGPQFETPAEIRAFRTLGADLVGMSTAIEAIAARHMGLAVLGISCVSNAAAGLSGAPLSHGEVQEAANAAAGRFKALLKAVISEL
ncbi:MAG: purine-nucleoside phosphorylase [Oscillospiraceae bacterium]|jgi:purine-nucleoside phosphorylase|nr:purine-nucleoside phosphorylase [Oscillospiraceae bacterium]